MIIAEPSGRCRQSPIVLGGEGQSLATKDTLSIGPVYIYMYVYIYIYTPVFKKVFIERDI